MALIIQNNHIKDTRKRRIGYYDNSMEAKKQKGRPNGIGKQRKTKSPAAKLECCEELPSLQNGEDFEVSPGPIISQSHHDGLLYGSDVLRYAATLQSSDEMKAMIFANDQQANGMTPIHGSTAYLPCGGDSQRAIKNKKKKQAKKAEVKKVEAKKAEAKQAKVKQRIDAPFPSDEKSFSCSFPALPRIALCPRFLQRRPAALQTEDIIDGHSFTATRTKPDNAIRPVTPYDEVLGDHDCLTPAEVRAPLWCFLPSKKKAPLTPAGSKQAPQGLSLRPVPPEHNPFQATVQLQTPTLRTNEKRILPFVIPTEGGGTSRSVEAAQRVGITGEDDDALDALLPPKELMYPKSHYLAFPKPSKATGVEETPSESRLQNRCISRVNFTSDVAPSTGAGARDLNLEFNKFSQLLEGTTDDSADIDYLLTSPNEQDASCIGMEMAAPYLSPPTPCLVSGPTPAPQPVMSNMATFSTADTDRLVASLEEKDAEIDSLIGEMIKLEEGSSVASSPKHHEWDGESIHSPLSPPPPINRVVSKGKQRNSQRGDEIFDFSALATVDSIAEEDVMIHSPRI